MLPLLERDVELRQLEDRLASAREGHAGLLLLEGPAGIGKTRLLDEARRRAAQDGFRVLTARGSELEADFPFGVARQLFEAPLADPRRAERWLAGAAESAAPAVAAHVASDGPAGDATFALLHGLFWLTINASTDEPLALAVDDLHWADRPTLRWLAFALRRLEGSPVLVAATLRTAEPGTDPALLAELVADPATQAVRPRPLSQAAVTDLAATALGRPPEVGFAATAHEATGGNPLLLGELLRSVATGGEADPSAIRDLGPQAVARTVLARLARLSAHAREVARAVAVLGDGSTVAEIAALSDLPEAAVAAATGDLARVEVLRAEPPLRFEHPLVRDAVLGDLPPGERELRHGRAAVLRRARGAEAEVVAAQLVLAPRRSQPWACEVLRDAGRAALARGGAESAVALLARALDEASDPPGDLLLELAMAEALTAAPSAVAHLRVALDAVEDPAVRAQVAFVLARTLIFTQDPQGAAEVARRAAAELPAEMVDERHGLESAALLAIVFGAGTADDLARLEHLRHEPLDTGTGAKMLKTIVAFAWALTGGSAQDCGRLAAAALAGGDLVRADNGLLSFTAMNVLTVCEHPDAERQWGLALSDAHSRGSIFSAATAHLGLGYDHLRRGDLPAAEEALASGLDGLRLWGGEGDAVTLCVADLATARRERGDLVGARTALDDADPGEAVTIASLFRVAADAELLLAEGRAAAALEAATLLEELAGPISTPAWVPWRSVQARVLLAHGRADEAAAAAAVELPHARAFGAPGTVAHTLRTLGTALGADGIEHLEEAVAVVEGTGRALEEAKSLHALGSAIRRDRRPTVAREPLRRALDLASVLGAEPLAAAARAELQAAGVRPRQTALSGPGALTPSERRVAGLAADGRTNRDIAQELFVTPKTVEVHLSAAYRKLDIASRRELSAALALA